MNLLEIYVNLENLFRICIPTFVDPAGSYDQSAAIFSRVIHSVSFQGNDNGG